MVVRAETVLRDFTVRADLVETARLAAAQHDVTLSYVVARAARGFLAADAPEPVLTPAVRCRLAVRLPIALVADLGAAAETRGVSIRLLIEGALTREFAPARPPSWDPNRPSAEA